MPAPFEVMPMPDDLPDFITNDGPTHYAPAIMRPDLVLPPNGREAVEAHGWAHRGANSEYVFFERPGYWLRVHHGHGDWARWTASVMPEIWRVGGAGRDRYAPEELAPEFTGRGAIARATAFAQALIEENETWLADLGIELDHVAARLWHGTGRGGYMTNRSYSVRWKCFL